MNPALRLVRGVRGSVVGLVKMAVPWLPGLLLHRQAPVSLSSAGTSPMPDAEAALHVSTRSDCAKCGAAIAPDAPVRTLKKGLVHDTCPA